MDRWLRRGPLLHFPALLNASRSAALSNSTNSSRTRAAFTRTLPFNGAKYLQHRFGRSARGGSSSARAALFQERALATDKEQLWAASAAAVTVCKRREPDPSTSGEGARASRSAHDDLAARPSGAENNPCMHSASNSLPPSAGAAARQSRLCVLLTRLLLQPVLMVPRIARVLRVARRRLRNQAWRSKPKSTSCSCGTRWWWRRRRLLRVRTVFLPLLLRQIFPS
jgi:hypothetical protein